MIQILQVFKLLWKYREIFILSIALLIGVLFYNQIERTKETQASLENEVQNRKAFEMENSNLKKKAIQYEYSIEDLKISKDSINRALYQSVKDLKLKDKEIKELVFIVNKGQKKDTTYLPGDTVFTKDLHLDTIIGDKHFNTRLQLDYPNRIITTPTFVDSLSLIFSYKKETVEAPSKYFFIRWFQKKHEITVVDLTHSNPYVTTPKARYINIKKD